VQIAFIAFETFKNYLEINPRDTLAEAYVDSLEVSPINLTANGTVVIGFSGDYLELHSNRVKVAPE